MKLCRWAALNWHNASEIIYLKFNSDNSANQNIYYAWIQLHISCKIVDRAIAATLRSPCEVSKQILNFTFLAITPTWYLTTVNNTTVCTFTHYTTLRICDEDHLFIKLYESISVGHLLFKPCTNVNKVSGKHTLLMQWASSYYSIPFPQRYGFTFTVIITLTVN